MKNKKSPIGVVEGIGHEIKPKTYKTGISINHNLFALSPNFSFLSLNYNELKIKGIMRKDK